MTPICGVNCGGVGWGGGGWDEAGWDGVACSGVGVGLGLGVGIWVGAEVLGLGSGLGLGWVTSHTKPCHTFPCNAMQCIHLTWCGVAWRSETCMARVKSWRGMHGTGKCSALTVDRFWSHRAQINKERGCLHFELNQRGGTCCGCGESAAIGAAPPLRFTTKPTCTTCHGESGVTRAIITPTLVWSDTCQHHVSSSRVIITCHHHTYVGVE